MRRKALRLAQARAMASGRPPRTQRARQTWPSLSLAGARAARHRLQTLGEQPVLPTHEQRAGLRR